MIKITYFNTAMRSITRSAAPHYICFGGKSFAPADNLCAFIERLPYVKGPLAGKLRENC